MVSTVTISTVTIAASSSLVMQAGIVITIFLILFLAMKEILDAQPVKNNSKVTRKYLIVGIVPLLMGFSVIVATKVFELLA